MTSVGGVASWCGSECILAFWWVLFVSSDVNDVTFNAVCQCRGDVDESRFLRSISISVAVSVRSVLSRRMCAL